MTDLAISKRTKLKRSYKRASYNIALIHSIIDEAHVCHVGAQVNGQPMVQPTYIWRVGDEAIIHGSSKNGLFKPLIQGDPACITVTLIDGLVLARSAFHHSINYRSVYLYGQARVITSPNEKQEKLDALLEKIQTGRSASARKPYKKELKATAILAFPILEASAKVRTGPPIDDDEDMALNVWAGVVPIETQRGTPVQDPAQRGDP